MSTGQISHRWQRADRARRRLAAALLAGLAALVIATGCRGERSQAGAPPGPPRIVTLTPSATEVVAALGAAEHLVGVDEYTTYPPETAALPRVGTFLAPNLEAILRLRPTLVIVDDVHAGLAAALRDLRIPIVECPMHGLDDVTRSLTRVGDALDRRGAARDAVAAIERAVAELRARRQGGPRPRVLGVIDREPRGLGFIVAAGPGSWLDELLGIVGADNALASAPTRYPKLSLEELLRAAPEVIVETTYGADPAHTAAEWAAAARVPAVAAGRIAVLTDPYFMAPSPRVARALAELDAVVHPAGRPGGAHQAPPAPP